MTPKQIYACDICHKEYPTEQEARQCEESGSAKDYQALYAVGDRVLVRTGYGDETQKRTITEVVTEDRHDHGYILDECVSQKHTLLVARKMNGYDGLYINNEIRYAEAMDLIPDIPDATQYMLKMLPCWVEHEGDEYIFQLMNDGGTELRLGYIAAHFKDDYKYHHEGPFGGPACTIIWIEGIEDDNDLKLGLLQCRRFLEEKNLLQF
ncbi:MAG: hypothetical protein ACKV1O_30935 [Saprospiraceae bacterium]